MVNNQRSFIIASFYDEIGFFEKKTDFVEFPNSKQHTPPRCIDNLLYFGCRSASADYLYREELERYNAEGQLQLRVAFSRDQVTLNGFRL